MIRRDQWQNIQRTLYKPKYILINSYSATSQYLKTTSFKQIIQRIFIEMIDMPRQVQMKPF